MDRISLDSARLPARAIAAARTDASATTRSRIWSSMRSTRMASCASRWRRSRIIASGAAPEELETALRIVQTLEPSGIGARDLGECLSLQLRRWTAAPRVASWHWISCRTASRSWPRAITRGCWRPSSCSADELRVAMELIRSLDPRPGSKVGTFEPRAIVPDVIVRKEKKRWTGEHQRRHLSAHPGQPAVRRLLPAGTGWRDGPARATSAGSALAGAQPRAALPDDPTRRGSCRRAAT